MSALSENRKKLGWPNGSKAAFKARKRSEGDHLQGAMSDMHFGCAYYPEHVYQAMVDASVAVSKLRRELRRWR